MKKKTPTPKNALYNAEGTLTLEVSRAEFRALNHITAELFGAGNAMEVVGACWLLKAALANYKTLTAQLVASVGYCEAEGVNHLDLWEARIRAAFPVKKPRRRKAR